MRDVRQELGATMHMHATSSSESTRKRSTMDDDDLHGNGKNKPPPRRRRWCHCCVISGTTAATLLMFLLTNAVSVAVVSSGAGPSLLRRYSKPGATIVRLWDGTAALHADLNATQGALAAGRADLADLRAKIRTANELLRTLLRAMQEHDHAAAARAAELPFPVDGGWKREPAGELSLAVAPRMGMTGDAGEGPAFPPLGHACVRVQDDLERYMDYAPGGECPSDEPLAHRLMAAGCDPLPRRRCRPRTPKGFPLPAPLPRSLWTTPPDTTVLWDAFACKNYSCLAAAAITGCGGDGDGGACFDLRGNKTAAGGGGRWARDDGALTYSIDGVLAARPNGTVRIGLDLGGGSPTGNFAARMLERAGAVVLTAAVNAGAPFGSFVAARGLVPLHVTAAHRLPLFDGTMDIVHAGRDLGGGAGAGVMLEFALYDVYRVLRPGGLLWLDHFVCAAAQLNATFAPMVDRVGFRKLRWNAGRGKEKDRWYVSALLEKRMA